MLDPLARPKTPIRARISLPVLAPLTSTTDAAPWELVRGGGAFAGHMSLWSRAEDSVEAEVVSLSPEEAKGMGALVTAAGWAVERAVEADTAVEAAEMAAVSFQAETAARCKR
eukprot:3253168-Prymnesium_polylepis.3